MKSLFAKSHAIDFQNEGRHAMEQNQVVKEGDGVDDGFQLQLHFCKRDCLGNSFRLRWSQARYFISIPKILRNFGKVVTKSLKVVTKARKC